MPPPARLFGDIYICRHVFLKYLPFPSIFLWMCAQCAWANISVLFSCFKDGLVVMQRPGTVPRKYQVLVSSIISSTTSIKWHYFVSDCAQGILQKTKTEEVWSENFCVDMKDRTPVFSRVVHRGQAFAVHSFDALFVWTENNVPPPMLTCCADKPSLLFANFFPPW